MSAIVIGSIVVDNTQKAGRAAEKGARAQLGEERERRRQALEAAEFSEEELAQIEKTIEINDRDLARKERLIDSVDPALMEAGKQALALLQGQEAKTLEPLRRQRAEQRAKLEEQMFSRLGSGWETTTAGQRAINDFDAETAGVVAQEQDRTLGRLLGASQNTRNLANVSGNIAMQGNIFNMQGKAQERTISALIGTPIENASAPFVGDAVTARMQNDLIGSVIQVGGSIAGKAMGAM